MSAGRIVVSPRWRNIVHALLHRLDIASVLYFGVAWDVEFTDEFGAWWDGLTTEEQDSIASGVRLLENNGPTLEHPHSSKVVTSRHGRMRELRVQHAGRPTACSTRSTRAAARCC